MEDREATVNQTHTIKTLEILMHSKGVTHIPSKHLNKEHMDRQMEAMVCCSCTISSGQLLTFPAVGGNDVEMTPMNGQRDPNSILNECRDIDRGIDTIERNLERLRFLQQRSIDDTDASQNTATNRELDSLSSETMTLYRNFTQRIKIIKGLRESGDPRNKPQVGKVDRKLKKAINEYQQAETDFRHKLSAQMERQYRIVRPDASEAEVREAIEDTSNNQVFSQAVSIYSDDRGSIYPIHVC